MCVVPLVLRDGHLFLELDGELWLLDTGAPLSLGESRELTFGGEQFDVSPTYLDLTPEKLRELVGVPCKGLLGMDVMGRFDFILDLPNQRAEFSTGELEFSGTPVPLDDVMGVPVLTVQIQDQDYRMFFDTGAQLSYLQDDTVRESFPLVGTIRDFYPFVGRFETEVNRVEMSLAGVPFAIDFGRLPPALEAALMMGGTQGILGNQVLHQRAAGYFPRRRLLVLGEVCSK